MSSRDKSKLSQAGLSEVGHIVRQFDPERFFICLMMPAEIREDLFILLAFQYEVAKTREVVSDTQLGLIRLQWWHEVLEGKNRDSSPVTRALCEMIERRKLDISIFKTLLYAREFDLEDVVPSSVEGVKAYVRQTVQPLLQLVCAIEGCIVPPEKLEALAIRYGITGLLRAVPFHAAQQRCYIPQDLLSVHSVTVQDLCAGRQRKALQIIIRQLAKEAEVSSLCISRQESLFCSLLQKLTGLNSKVLNTLNYNVWDPRVAQGAPFWQLRLFFGL